YHRRAVGDPRRLWLTLQDRGDRDGGLGAEPCPHGTCGQDDTQHQLQDRATLLVHDFGSGGIRSSTRGTSAERGCWCLRAHAWALRSLVIFSPMPVRPFGTPVSSPSARADCHLGASGPVGSG